jgi:hypothetical protein
MKEEVKNVFVGDGDTGAVDERGFVAVEKEQYDHMAVKLRNYEQRHKEKTESFVNSERVKDTTPYVKVYRLGMMMDNHLTKSENISWQCIKLTMRKGREFIYLRPTALCKLAKHYFKRVMDLPEASRAISALKKYGYILNVGRDLYMVNHNLVFNGDRSIVLMQHSKYSLFGIAPNGEEYKEKGIPDLNGYLRSIAFDYEMELAEAVAYVQKQTRLKTLASDTANSDIQKMIERVLRLAKENREINEEKRRKLKEKQDALLSNN